MKVRVMLAAVLSVSLFAASARAEYFDLEKAVDTALKVSTNVGISREQLRSARSGVLSSYANLLPDISLTSYSGHSFSGPSSSGFVDAQGRFVTGPATDFSSYSFGLSGNMTLFDWGASFDRVAQSKQGANAAGFDLEYQKDVVKALVIREYYDLVKQKKLGEVQKDDVEAQKRNLEQVEAFYRIGSRTKADYLQARVNLANSELNLLNAKNAESIAGARLKSRLNLPQSTPLDVDENLDFKVVKIDPDAEFQYMAHHRSDLLASRRRIAASRAGLRAAQKGWLPSLAGTFRYSWSDRAAPNGLAIFEKDYVWSVGLFVNWPIFDRFQTRAGIDRARADYRIAQYNLKQSKLDAVLDVKQILLNLKQARERVDLADETVQQAQENLRLAEERYRVGAGTVLETFQATASLTSAQASLIEARVDYLVNRADLQRATGRAIVAR